MLAAEKMRRSPCSGSSRREVEGQALRQEQEADLQHVDGHARQAEQPEDRQQIAAQRPERGVPVADDEIRVGRQPGLAAELAAAVVDQEIRPARRRASSARPSPANSMAAEPRSWLLATCPSCRACCRRCGVGSRVFSPA